MANRNVQFAIRVARRRHGTLPYCNSCAHLQSCTLTYPNQRPVIIVLLFLVLLQPILSPRLKAQPQQRFVLSDNAQFSLITILPGDAIYSMYGHSAVRVVDPIQDIDWSFNYGTFHFDQSFLPRFLYGKLDYFLSVQDYQRALAAYRDVESRPVIEQVLHLTAVQRNSLFSLITRNAQNENRYYRYDFLYDNCSTRIRDVFEETLGPQVEFAPEPDPHLSFRQLLDLYHGSHPFLDLGIDLVLGLPTDRMATARETVFLPLFLMTAFDHAVIEIDDTFVPLVARTDTVAWIEGRDIPKAGVPWTLLLSWLLLGSGIWVTYINVRKGKPASRLFDVPLYFLAGLAGLLIVFLWFFSLHTVTALNINLFSWL